jgi:hypothetical protein
VRAWLRELCRSFPANKFDVDKLFRIESPFCQQVIDKLAVFFMAYIQADFEEMDASVQRASVALRGGVYEDSNVVIAGRILNRLQNERNPQGASGRPANYDAIEDQTGV